MGVCIDSAAVTTTAAQVSSGDNADYVSTIINTDAVWRAKLAGSATTDAAITLLTQSALDLTGLSPTAVTDEFMIWGYEGANEGIVRRGETGNVTLIAFPYDILAGDTMLQTTTVIAEATQWPTLTTALTQVRADSAVDANNDNFTVVEQQLRGISENGRTNSYTYIVAANHAFGTVGTIAT